jgi:hypothetical protein
MSARHGFKARILIAMAAAGALAGLGSAPLSAAAATAPNTGTWANASNMQWACSPSGVEEVCSLQGPAACTETNPAGTVIGGCSVTLDFGEVTLAPGCTGSGGANFVYFPSVGVEAQTSVTISVSGGTASVAGAWNNSSSSGTVSASFTFVCPLPGNSGSGRVNWSGQVNES